MNSKKKKEPTPEWFIGHAEFDKNGGGYIWGVDKNSNYQMVAEIRGWGAIQQLFKTEIEAAVFQDKIGKFISDAINEKIERDVSKNKNPFQSHINNEKKLSNP